LDFFTREFWAAIFNRRMLICIFTGFTSGLPLYLLLQLVPAWLRTEGIGLKEIGFFALVQLPYTWKFFWAPFLDRYCIPSFGRRRTWMLVTQVALLFFIIGLGFWQPEDELMLIAGFCVAIAFFSATQDIALDAYRRELLPDIELGLGNSIHVNAYRASSFIPGALGLILADFLDWESVFLITAMFMLVGISLTLFIQEAFVPTHMPGSLREVVKNSFADFFNKQGISGGLCVLLFLVLYKFGDSLATALSTPFYIDLGFSLTEIGFIAKNAAFWPSVIGGMLGGILMLKTGINRALWLFGVVQVVTILGFAWLVDIGPNRMALAIVISLEYLGVGLGTAAFIAFIARNTTPAFAATQFALFTALTALPRTVINSFAGLLVESMGWQTYFYMCTLLALPGMFLLLKVAPWNGDQPNGNQADSKSSQ
jgi:PAT family beta-lactamase induction signal transducer AmpG